MFDFIEYFCASHKKYIYKIFLLYLFSDLNLKFDRNICFMVYKK